MKIIIENKYDLAARVINEEIEHMRVTGLISADMQLIQESWLSQQIKKVPDLFGLVSGTRGLEYAEKTGSEDAWKLFRAMVGPGTDEDTIQEIFERRSNDLPHLNAEFDDLIQLVRSVKSIKLDDIKFAIAGPLAGDQDDAANWMGDAGLIVSALLLTTGAAAYAPWLAGLSQVVRLGATLGGPVDSWGGRSGKRRKERLTQGTTGGIFTPFFKMYTKLVQTIPEKSLMEYLDDDGMHEEAHKLRDALKGSDDPNPEIRDSTTGRLHNAELGNKRNAYGT